MTILWDKKLIKLSDGSYIAWGLKRKKFFFASKNELKLNCSLIEYYEQREKCEEKVISDYRKINAELKKELEISRRCWQDQKNISLEANCLLYKAKEIIKIFLCYEHGEAIIEQWSVFLNKAEQFLKECE